MKLEVVYLKILVCDDEKLIRDVIKEYLKLEGYEVCEAETGKEAVNLVKNNDFDLIIMDIMMPQLDGYQAIKEIKREKDIPCLMLSARSEEFDKLMGFELGIDDYVTKPFSPKELIARIKAITKRNEKSTNNYVLDGLILNDSAHEVIIDGELANLTPKEYELLKYFMENKNIALSREQLLTNIWGYDFYGDDRTVDTHVKTLRNNLGKYRDLIKTIRKVGYKFEYKKENK